MGALTEAEKGPGLAFLFVCLSDYVAEYNSSFQQIVAHTRAFVKEGKAVPFGVVSEHPVTDYYYIK